MKKIAFITDIHLDDQFPKDVGVDSEKNWKQLLNDIRSKNIEEIIYGGDIGQASAHPYFFESLKTFRLNIVLGNHDHFQEVIPYFKPSASFDKSELYYSSEQEFFKFIFLDSSLNEISETQLAWLKNELITEKKILLFLHHPILQVNTAVDSMYPLKNRNEVKEILNQSNRGITVLCGHYHMLDECKEKNIHQFVTCASSCQIEKEAETLKMNNDFFGYRILLIHKDEVKVEVVIKNKVEEKL